MTNPNEMLDCSDMDRATDAANAERNRKILKAKDALALDLANAIDARYMRYQQERLWDTEDARIFIASLLPDTRAEAQAEQELFDETFKATQPKHASPSPMQQLRDAIDHPGNLSIRETIQATIDEIARLRQAIEHAEEQEQQRWQERFNELCKGDAPDGRSWDTIIDGGGCDSGDPLDFTHCEVWQRIHYLEDICEERKITNITRTEGESDATTSSTSQ